MNKSLLVATALAVVAGTSSTSALASSGTPSYCIPPASAQAAAENETSATVAAISTYSPAGLAALHSVNAAVGVGGAGRIEVTLEAHHTVVGRAHESVKAGGCEQLTIKLTAAGRKLLKRSKKLTLDIRSVFAPRRGSRGVARGSVTLS
jgi:hypothetical protein